MTAHTTLQLGAETSTLTCSEAGRTHLQQELSLGTASLARQWMRHTPPTPLDIERAIEQTEDVVMPLSAKLVRTERLQLSGTGAALILAAVGAEPDVAQYWTLDAVEDIFNRIAMVSEGRPPVHEALPTAPEFYAAMVIVRECLHHLRFAGVAVRG